MPLRSEDWGTIHPSVYRHAAEPARRVASTLRPRGTIRYRCPVSGSFALITDAATLARLAERDTRLRCADCGEMHLVMQALPVDGLPAITIESAKP